jgi:hypothetical protein
VPSREIFVSGVLPLSLFSVTQLLRTRILLATAGGWALALVAFLVLRSPWPWLGYVELFVFVVVYDFFTPSVFGLRPHPFPIVSVSVLVTLALIAVTWFVAQRLGRIRPDGG